MKSTTRKRRATLWCLLLAGTISTTGCSTGGMSLASMNPFSKSSSGVGASDSAATRALVATTEGTKNVFKTVSHSTKSAFDKSSGAIAGVFGRQDASVDGEVLAEDDPLSLHNKPDSIGPEVYVANGQLWESTGNFGKAIESYNKALATDPKNAPALASIARLHFRQDDHAASTEFFRKAIALTPEDAGLHNDLGLTLSRTGQHGAAAQSIQRALQLAPGTSRYVNNLASVQFESGNTAAAFQTLAKTNQPAVAHFNMAYLHYRKGQVGQAKEQLSRAMSFESQAATDAAVKRAVDRSKEMLAQIDASGAPAGLPAQPGATNPRARIAQTPGATRSYQVPVRGASMTGPSGPAKPASAVLPSGGAAPSYTPGSTSSPSTPISLPATDQTTKQTGGFSLPEAFGG